MNKGVRSYSLTAVVVSLFFLCPATLRSVCAEEFAIDNRFVGGGDLTTTDQFIDPGFYQAFCDQKGPLNLEVDTTEDQTDWIIGDCKCLTPEGTCTLRAAIQEANAYKGGPVAILVPSGDYVLTLTGPDEADAFSGDLDITSNAGITIQGNGFGGTVILGRDRPGGPFVLPENRDRVFDIRWGEVVIRDLAVEWGYVASYGVGGGILVEGGGSLILDGVLVRNNFANTGGGGIFTEGPTVLDRSLIQANWAGYGGGILCQGLESRRAKLTVQGSAIGPQDGGRDFEGNAAIFGGGVYLNSCPAEFRASTIYRNNFATDFRALYASVIREKLKLYDTPGPAGGGIFSFNSPMRLTKYTRVSGNASLYGGGIYLANNVATIDQSIFDDNIGWLGGGGIYSRGFLNISESALRRNHAGLPETEALNDSEIKGGGILSEGDGILDLRAITISHNSAASDKAATSGGGVFTRSGRGTVLKNATISGNEANFGGGIYLGETGLDINGLSAHNVTIAKNKALKNPKNNNSGLGGGLYVAQRGAPALLSNTILADNTDDNGHGPDCAGPILSGGYNLIGSPDADFCAISGSPDNGDQLGNLKFRNTVDPLLGPLSENGGWGETHALEWNSPAVDKGNPNLIDHYACEPEDQRGMARPQGPRCDIGAFERRQ